MRNLIVSILVLTAALGFYPDLPATEKTRVIITSDGEIDDQCSMVRFLLYANEWDIEGIITSSSQYHWQGHKWPGDDWIAPYIGAYAQIYPNLLKHDAGYPTPEFLQERTLLGNVKAEGEMDEVTPGSKHIVKILLDESDDRPIWVQAWGGTNTIARALRTIEKEHPRKMKSVARKLRFFFIWEQDTTFQDYIRTRWGWYEIPTIISDQFEAIAYRWKQVQPGEMQPFFDGAWMKDNILEDHGPLCSMYKAHENGDFRSEGDSPAFLHTIPTGLRNLENPGWGGWGGRYTRVRDNTWLDPVPVEEYEYPRGRWYGGNGWGRLSLREGTTTTAEQRREYFRPIWRWSDAIQNDFASRADWSVKPYDEANHPPVVKLAHAADLDVTPGTVVELSAVGTSDPDGDELEYHWWQYSEAGSYAGHVEIRNAGEQKASFTVPDDSGFGDTIHVIAEVTDTGSPPLTRYQRVVVTVTDPRTIRIMPLGDSITYDNRRKDIRPIGTRIAYRKTLHDLLKSAGYAFDFVGSEDAGHGHLSDEMDDNAGYPGITDEQLAVLIGSGYSPLTSLQITPGPFLETYPADIILLHIGTNHVDASPNDVADILDNIRRSDQDAHIIVARIINRYPYSEVTTLFNDNVEAMIKARGDPRITMVDMEDGAGIDYYTDMDDDLHPNQTGYDKMAAVWFDALVALLSTPEFSDGANQ